MFILIPTNNCTLLPNKETSLCNRGRTLQKYCNLSKSRAWIPVPTDTSLKQLLRLKLRDHCKEVGAGHCKRQRNRKLCCEIVSSGNVREVTSLKSHQHGCLNKTRTRSLFFSTLPDDSSLLYIEAASDSRSYQHYEKIIHGYFSLNFWEGNSPNIHIFSLSVLGRSILNVI